MSTEFKIQNDGTTVELLIFGRIDENTDFSKIKMPNAISYVINLENVNSLNSMGLRNWMLWIKKTKFKSPVQFRNCQRAVVDQMSILQGFLPFSAIVSSFYVPYYCSSCDHEENFLAIRGKDFQEATPDTKETLSLPHEIACPSCQKLMEIDVMPQKFFMFLKLRIAG